MKDPNWWERFRAWLAYLIFPEPNDWYVEACERANALEIERDNLFDAVERLQHEVDNLVQGGYSDSR